MPFKSEKQRRYMHANLPEIAQRWERDYANGGVASQGGVKNYLGQQPMVEAPKYWQSSPDHPTTELAYITPAEKDLLVKQDLHDSLNGGVNRGPSGIMSLNGWGDAPSGGQGPAGSTGGGYGETGKSYGDQETYGRNVTTTTGSPHGTGPRTVTRRTKTVSPKDHFTQSWTGPKGWFGGGYRDLKVPGQTKHGHKSGIGGLLLGGLLSMINPALGMAYRGYKGIKGFTDKYGTKIGDWREKTTGYRTQAEWEEARKNRQMQSRYDNLMNRKLSGKNYSQKNLDMLSAMGIGPSKDSLGGALNRDANQSMNMFDGPFSRTHLQSVAKGLPPQGPTGMYTLDDMLMSKPMGPYSSQPGPWNEMGAFKAPMQSPTGLMKPGMYGSVPFNPGQGGIHNTQQGKGFFNNFFNKFF